MQDAFGEPYVQGQSGIGSIGAGGALDISSFTQVFSAISNTATLNALTLHELDPALFAGPFPTPPPVVEFFEIYLYSAAFGAGDSHVGTAVRLGNQTDSMLVFVPMTIVQQNGDIGADEVASFLAASTNGVFDGPGGYLQWLYATVPSVIPPMLPSMSAIESGDGPCDQYALAECVQGAVAQLQSDLAAAQGAYDEAVNDIMEEWADDAIDDSITSLGAGTATGALLGAFGGPVGVVIGGAGGFIAGGIGWLVDTALDADDARDDIAEAGEDFHNARCAAMQTAADSITNCYAEYCPELADHVSQIMAVALAESGC